jgi:hypothetical protein
MVVATGFGDSIDGRHPISATTRSALTIRPLLQYSEHEVMVLVCHFLERMK